MARYGVENKLKALMPGLVLITDEGKTAEEVEKVHLGKEQSNVQ